MKTIREKGKPTITQCLPDEAARLTISLARRAAKTNKSSEIESVVYVFGAVSLPASADVVINRELLPVTQFEATEKDSKRSFLYSVTAEDRVIVVYASEEGFMRRGYFDHSPEHKLIWRIRKSLYDRGYRRDG